MNANELIAIGEHLQSLNDDNLAQRVFDGTEVQNFIGGTLEHLERSRIHETATEPCDWCVDNFAYHFGEIRTIYDDENGNDASLSLRVWRFCPNCGRQLPEANP